MKDARGITAEDVQQHRQISPMQRHGGPWLPFGQLAGVSTPRFG
jgi:hypothetical protein